MQSELVCLADAGFDLSVLGWGDELPTFGEEIDLSALDDDDDDDDDLSSFAEGVRRSIMIDFEEADHEEAKA